MSIIRLSTSQLEARLPCECKINTEDRNAVGVKYTRRIPFAHLWTLRRDEPLPNAPKMRSQIYVLRQGRLSEDSCNALSHHATVL